MDMKLAPVWLDTLETLPTVDLSVLSTLNVLQTRHASKRSAEILATAHVELMPSVMWSITTPFALVHKDTWVILSLSVNLK